MKNFHSFIKDYRIKLKMYATNCMLVGSALNGSEYKRNLTLDTQRNHCQLHFIYDKLVHISKYILKN